MSAGYKRRQIGRAIYQRAAEFAVGIAAGVLVFLAAENTSITGVLHDSGFSASLAAATKTAPGTVDPVVEVVGNILEPVHKSLQLVLSLVAALIALAATEHITRAVNVKREVTVDNLYEADARVVELVDSILAHTSRFQDKARYSPELQSLLSEHLKRKIDNFLGFLQRIADLDIDIDRGSERSFTTDLIRIADRKICAVSVNEEEFYGGDTDAKIYMMEQADWLAKGEAREIVRIFVRPREGQTPPPHEVMSFDVMIEHHNKVVDEISLSQVSAGGRPSLDRYRFYSVSWSDWMGVMKENADLVIYDDRYVRKGTVDPDESRDAQFRANPADVGDFLMKFRSILALSTASVDTRRQVAYPTRAS